MTFNYSQINSRTFEKLSHKYLEQKYPDFQWDITPLSRDGNKDILCKYKVLNQDQEYWAEAKFTKSQTPHTLSKGQLDPTLISALLSPKHVSLCFISNNQITETYHYRLKDFKIKTNIGIELVLKDEFEDWLSRNPELLKEYKISLLSVTEPPEHGNLQICSAIVTNRLNSNQYKTENYLIEGVIYYLYVMISSNYTREHMGLNVNSDFKLLNRSELLDNSEDFCVEKGKQVYKFELLPCQLGKIALRLQLIDNQTTVADYLIINLTITLNSNVALSYIQQEKSLSEISCCIRESNEHNFLIPIIGNGATGKTKLLRDLYDDLIETQNSMLVSFSGFNYLDANTLIKILLFFNIGNVLDYEKKDILSQIEMLHDENQKIYYKKLVEGLFGKPESCVEELAKKLSSYDVCLLYPTHSSVQQILLLDDVHKGNNILFQILKEFLKQFVQHKSNQSIVFACREDYEGFMFENDWSKPFYLNGLTKEDKLATISQYFSFDEDIRFDRATDDLIVFINILQSKLQTDVCQNRDNDSISKRVELIRAFEKPKIATTFQYKEKLNQLKTYHHILEVIYLVNFGIDYTTLIQMFSHDDINCLLDKRVIKRLGEKIFPYHDYYVQTYFEEHKISDATVETVKKIWRSANDCEEQYLYLSLLLKSGYHVYCQIEKEAHMLEYHYFKITDYYKSYIIAKAFESHLDFNEPLSLQDLYDLMILAVSSGYFEKPENVKKRYMQLIIYGKPLASMQEVQGIILRSQSEIVNIDYWELNVADLTEKIQSIIKQSPSVTHHSNEDLICAYLNLLNRKMVVALALDNFKQAEELFQENLKEIERLRRKEYVGYLYMDYAKGLYNDKPIEALECMEKAQDIFRKLGTECRRFLDCSCEIEYLKCLIADTNEFSNLECSAQDLFHAQYLELYAKAKLKLAALKLTKCAYVNSKEDIKQELYLSEYVIDYPFTGRLRMLHKMLENAFFIYTNEAHKVVKRTANDKKLMSDLGISYRKIWDFNEDGIKRSIQFWNKNVQLNVYALDARIW